MSIIQTLKDEIIINNSDNKVFTQGVVTSIGDGMLMISGLINASYLDIVEIVTTDSELQSSAKAVIFEINKDTCKAVLLSLKSVYAGQIVRLKGEKLNINIDPYKTGIIYNALGEIIVGSNIVEVNNLVSLKIEDEAPQMMNRKPVSRPMSTGILAIDCLANIGKGQRQLIIGDRQTGKTSIAIDTIINQKDSNTISIYCAIGQKQSNVALIYQQLKDKGVVDNTVMFSAGAHESIAMQYLVPFAAVTLGQYLMNQGKDVVIVYDDLSKHAVAWRQLSLLLKRPVGREAYPGDVFYLHSRLLERGGQLEDSVGGGSLSALPIVETQANDVTGYIPTNVISITDGQIYLEASLFNKGVRPAISPGLSVSRVGGAAQSSAIKKNAGKLKLELSQYRELASFSQIGSGLDAKTKATLDHGALLTQSLIQKNLNPLNYAQQVARLRVVNLPAIKKVDKNTLTSIFSDLDENFNFGEISKDINDGKWNEDLAKISDDMLNKFMIKYQQ